MRGDTTEESTGGTWYDEEPKVCTGCGSILPERHEEIGWCPSCAPEMHGAENEVV